MKNQLINPFRHKRIIEMEDQEVGYISEDSLCFDIQEGTGDVIYALFHYDIYSSTDSNPLLPGYNITVICHIKDNKKTFEVFNRPKGCIDHDDLTKYSERLFTILAAENETIEIYDTLAEDNKEIEEENDELYNEIRAFIEDILDNTDEDESVDEIYGIARTNFTKCIIQNSQKDNWIVIERILQNIYIIVHKKLEDKDSLAEKLSTPESTEEYIKYLSKKDLSGYIESDIEGVIESISLLFYEFFEEKEDNKEIIKSKTKEELEQELEDAISKQDFEKAAEIRNELEELEKKKQ